ncbi:phage terminase small subunit [Latilactobacillus sakei]|uniref:phage terminase small subunit n=1 Tax=Latilactobacillus sakei TaxID=1599 RepID=UPI0020C7E2AE|nr:small subunit of terminase [Latilactobacillus sakei]
MAQARNPNRDLAYKMWMDSGCEKKLADIAKEIGVTSSTVRKWKSQDKWKRSAPNDKGSAPFVSLQNNKNAVGNSGGAPSGNKNAVTTGQYETIMLDQMTDEERAIFEGVTDDPLMTVNTEIRQLKVRQYRITQRYQEALKGLNDAEIDELSTIRNVKELVEVNGRAMTVKKPQLAVVQQSKHVYRKLDDLLKIEDALTSVSNSLLKAIRDKAKLIGQASDADIGSSRAKILADQARIARVEADKAEGVGADNPIIMTMQAEMHRRFTKGDED